MMSTAIERLGIGAAVCCADIKERPPACREPRQARNCLSKWLRVDKLKRQLLAAFLVIAWALQSAAFTLPCSAFGSCSNPACGAHTKAPAHACCQQAAQCHPPAQTAEPAGAGDAVQSCACAAEPDEQGVATLPDGQRTSRPWEFLASDAVAAAGPAAAPVTVLGKPESPVPRSSMSRCAPATGPRSPPAA